MFHLEGSGLRVSILDPVADRARLGSRYCHGGYVWQVADAKHGDLLSGPAYPQPDPDPFHGQGLPEAFEIALGQQRARVGEDVYVIGAGRVRRRSPVRPFHVRDNRELLEAAIWEVTKGPSAVAMASRQGFRECSLDLIKRVSLEGRAVTSATTVVNRGAVEIPVRWFAHPFFPHAGLEVCAFSRDAAFPSWVPEAGGFLWNERGALARKADFDWAQGCFQLLMVPFGYPLDVAQRHPRLGTVKVECRFAVAWLPVWANENTVSVEPYFHTVVPPGGRADWAIRYCF